MLLALRGEVEPSAEPANGTASPSPKQGRAEKAAAVRTESARQRRAGAAQEVLDVATWRGLITE